MRIFRPIKLIVLSVLVFLFISAGLAAENGLGFDMDLGLGTVVIEDPVTGDPESWQNLSLRPELSFGKWGIGLAVDLNFTFSDDLGNPGFRIREEDWIPSEEYSFLELYLPLFRYVRYGQKGDDLYGKIGSIDDFLLGNGFIIANYSNSLFLPEQRVSGLSLDLDGQLFNFPYLGIETMVGNLAAFDLMGGRIFTRPIYFTGVPIIKELQLGFTAVADLNPFYYEQKNPDTIFSQGYMDAAETVAIWGIDLRLPILQREQVSLAAFTDFVVQNGNSGGMLGVGGRLFSFLDYGAQIRLLGDNFIPVYFDSSYDLYRGQKYAVYNGDISIPGYFGWFASLGFVAFEEAISFSASLEGPFAPDPSIDEKNPTLTAGFHVDPELLFGFSVDASYQKKYITDIADLISAENAVIQAQIGYNTGPAVISMIYDLKYAPTPGPESDWQITTRLETSLSLF
jgi:hypothetical protein